MKPVFRNTLASLAAHAAVVAAVWVAQRPVFVTDAEPREEPLVFELLIMEQEAAETGRERPDKEPVVAEPVAEQPVVAEPVVAEPVVAEPVVAEPVVEEPAAAEPEAVEPVVAEPVATEPAAGEGPLVTAAEERAKVVSEPKALSRISPRYPRSARAKGREGAVTIEFSVEADGKVGTATVVASSGFPELDAAAMASARKAVFVPATEDGVPVSSTLRLTFEFRLK